MIRAYLDTNVHSAIADGEVLSPDVEAFRVAVVTGRLLAPISPANLDELLGQFDTARAATVARLASVRRLVGFHGMLKQPGSLLQDAVEAYAAGLDAPAITLPEAERRSLAGALANVIAGGTRHDHQLLESVTGVNQLKDRWVAGMQEAQRRASADPTWVARTPTEWQTLPFADFFATSGPGMTAALAEPLGCAEACRERGLHGLLECRPVRLCVGVVLSQIYAQMIGTLGHRERRQAARTDGYDIWHAVLASTADIFVTFDERLADHVERIPGLGAFRVVRSLAELVTEVHHGESC